MFGLGLLAAWLYLAAILANAEPVAHFFTPCNRQACSDIIRFTEVDLSQRCLTDKLIAEGKIASGGLVAADDVMGFININQHLPRVKLAGPLIAFVPGAAVIVVVAGINSANLQHLSNLSLVCPRKLSTIWARCNAMERRHRCSMIAIRAQPPIIRFYGIHIDLINRQLMAAGIEAVIRREFRNGGRSPPAVFMGHACIPIFSLLVAACILGVHLSGEDCLEHDASFREGIVGKQPLIRQEDKGIFILDFAHDFRQATSLQKQFLPLFIERSILGFLSKVIISLFQLLDILAQGFALIIHFLKSRQDSASQALLLCIALGKGADALAGFFRKLGAFKHLLKHSAEAR